MNNRDIAKMGFAVLAAVMSYNFADTIVHAEETSVEPVKEESTVEDTDPILDVVEPTEETEEAEDTTVTVGGSDTSAKLTEGWSSDSMQFVQNGAYVTNGFAEVDGQKYYFDENGNKVTGFKTIGTESYYFNEAGVMQTGLQVLQDQNTGIQVYSLKKEDGKLNVIKLRNDGFEGNTKNVLLFFLWKI